MRVKVSILLLLLSSLLVASPAYSAPPSEPVDSILCRGYSAVGFSYEWGGECWCSNGCDPDFVNCSAGVCTPNAGSTGCPDCTHSGTYGADCSGFVSKAWQVPDPYATNACDVSRFTASAFTSNYQYWNVVPMNDLHPADAVASSSHVILVTGYEDQYGENEVIEAAGCNYGVINHSRTFSSVYSGARRINITECTCTEGEVVDEECGDCGSRSKSCVGCVWTPWSDCQGPDPEGAAAECTADDNTALGACSEGRMLCVAGWLTCQSGMPTIEVCDGIDNDCDGIPDNGTPETLGEGYTCQDGCGTGTTKCIDGKVQCVVTDTTCNDSTPTDTDNNGTSSGGCGCSVHSNTPPVNLIFLIFLLFFVRKTVLRREKP